MAKIIKKKFFEVDIPMINEKFEVLGGSIEDFSNKIIKVDATRKLKGKSVDLVFKIVVEEGKAIAQPKKITLLPFFIAHMLHKGTSYVEDSIAAETKDNKVSIKPFFITRKKVSRAVRRTLRNSARNWIIEYLKAKTSAEAFEEILSNQMQRPLSLKLKKIYPLAICEIRIFEIKNPLEGKPAAKEAGQAEIKVEEKEISQKIEGGEIVEKELKIEEKAELAENASENKEAEEKPSKKRKVKKEDKE